MCHETLIPSDVSSADTADPDGANDDAKAGDVPEPTPLPKGARERAEAGAQLLRLLGAAASGIGALGLIAAVGGAVLLARFDAAGIPAEEALSVVPKSLLLTVGADTLAPILGAIAAIVGISWIVQKLVEAAKREFRSEYLAILLVGLGVLTYLIEVHWLTSTRSLVTVVISVVAAGGTWVVIGDLTKSNTVRGIVLAVAVAAAAGVISWVNANDRPKVRGVAILSITDSHDVSGLFVAETSDRVYIAQVSCRPGDFDRGQGATGRLLVLPRSSVAELVIGRNMRLSDALRQGQEMLTVLRQQNGRPKVSTAPRDPNCVEPVSPKNPGSHAAAMKVHPSSRFQLSAMAAVAASRHPGGYRRGKNYLADATVTNNGWAAATIVGRGSRDRKKERPGAPRNKTIVFRLSKGRWHLAAYESSYRRGPAFTGLGVPSAVRRALGI